MRLPASWLTEHLALGEGVTQQQLADALIGVGIEVEEVHSLDAVTGPLVVGMVIEVTELTGFNKPIRYCRVDVGETAAETTTGLGFEVTERNFADQQYTRGIVAGATNFAEGDLVVVALPGAVLPGGFAISERETYGHRSEGMMCSVRELGLGEDHSGILVLDPGSALPGDDARSVLGLEDAVFEVEPTPDKGHAMSVRGLARELSCAFDAPFGDPAQRELEPADGHAWPVRIEDPNGCSRFTIRRVSGLDPNAPSPWWLRRRLLLAGIRSISLAVDVTNYVMLELGQPLHAFDTEQVSGGLVVRRAKDGESLVTLDGENRELDPDDVVIADDSGVISLAGTMGGASTEIGAGSTDVLLEAAHWDPASISRTARRHKLYSEAAKRFERFTDPAVPPVAVELAAELLRRYGGGTVEAGRTDEGDVPAMPPVSMPIDLPDRTAGVRYARGVTARRLTQIGCKVSISTGDDGTAMVTAEPPSWRGDLTRPADLVEEVLRLEGYDSIPSTLPPAPAGSGLSEAQRRRRSVARALAEAGYVEVVPFPFVARTVWDDFGLAEDDPRRNTVSVLNPLESDKDQLATTLLPGLLDAAKRNVSRGFRDLSLFHLGRVVAPTKRVDAAPDPAVDRRPSDEEVAELEAAVPDQPVHIAAVLTGQRRRAGWWGAGEAAGWSDAVEAARTVAAAAGAELDVRAAATMPWHPGRCAALLVEGITVGHAGELHPTVVERLGLPKRAVAMELDLDAIPIRHRRPAPVISPYPPVLLDVALVVDAAVPAADLAESLRAGGGELLEDIRLFDVYTGQQVGEGNRSLAYKLRFRAPDRTLTVEEATSARDAAVAEAATRLGATLRG
ncbi:phenylalanine--tRNA ligase subunit beta [Haloechinothrix sp. LS1_15]|uniref:phenylalanine--tRNA ligase subunit beta n=1 Tax=Haloechinothrix sp. LS1_15 TaxID=2652248 RepID=UPI00294676C5|nr:phenylalanine--tRNA ligase subunit beta [Haloechinothrix sp. LS1_15]MDV6012262.1 phenylalanine--tRNA ligase subunit beta [Haloechinothrix sp. LS1_15]